MQVFFPKKLNSLYYMFFLYFSDNLFTSNIPKRTALFLTVKAFAFPYPKPCQHVLFYSGTLPPSSIAIPPKHSSCSLP